MTDEKAITVQTNVSLGAAVLPSPAHVISYATDVSKELSTIINRQKLYSVINGRKYVQVEGWTTMGAMLGVVPRTVSVEEIHDGVFEATVELVRVSDGAIIGRGIAECGADDETDKYGKPVWANRARYARKSMAITRATGKAFRLSFSWIMKLAGYEATPWEEMLGVVEGEAEEVRPPAPRTSNASSRRSASTATQAQPVAVEGEVVEEGEPAPKPHWIDNPKARTKFWVYTKNDIGLTEEQVYEALGVKSIHDFDGTMQQAKDKLDTYADALRHSPPDEPKPSGKPKQPPMSEPPPWDKGYDEPLFPDAA